MSLTKESHYGALSPLGLTGKHFKPWLTSEREEM